MKSLSKVNDVLYHDNSTRVSIDIYNHTDAVMRAVTDIDLITNTNENSTHLATTATKYVTMTLSLHADVYEWLSAQQDSYEEVINRLLLKAVQQTSLC